MTILRPGKNCESVDPIETTVRELDVLAPFAGLAEPEKRFLPSPGESREVLLAIPNVTAEAVDEYIAQRETARQQKQVIPVFPPAAPFAAGNSMLATIRTEARLDDGVVFTREAGALMRPVPRKPVTFIAWRESTAPPPAEKIEARP